MQATIYYVFDGSYYGLLCCLFESFERKEFAVLPVIENYQVEIFAERRMIQTDMHKAHRVQEGLKKKLGGRTQDFFNVYLSEDRGAWNASLRIMQHVFQGQVAILQNFGDPDVIYFAQILRKVSRERHRMKAFVRFQKSADGLYFSLVEPDFNVLPLIASFFRKRYADQKWLIYDVKRSYGLLYEAGQVSEVTLSAQQKDSLTKDAVIEMDTEDAHFQLLWKNYFKSTNIEARRNMKLHLQHVPRRYWKYLTEKQ